MARVSTYLNFDRRTEEAFGFYRGVFGGDFAGPLHRWRDAPPHPEHPLAEADRDLVMHVELPITGGHLLMGTDAPSSMGFTVTAGNMVSINLEPDTREEADRLFAGLSEGGQVQMPMQDMFWGAYYGALTDRFGVRWMINCATRPNGA